MKSYQTKSTHFYRKYTKNSSAKKEDRYLIVVNSLYQNNPLQILQYDWHIIIKETIFIRYFLQPFKYCHSEI